MAALSVSVRRDKHVGHCCGKMCYRNCLTVARAGMKVGMWRKVEQKIRSRNGALASPLPNLQQRNLWDHRNNSFRHVCTVHHTKNSAEVVNKPASELGRETDTGA